MPAPSGGIAVRYSSYRNYSGTSPAAAHVSGAAAVLLSIKPHWTPQNVRACLIDSADRIPTLEAFCPEGRRLNMHRAVENALQIPNGLGKGAPKFNHGGSCVPRLRGL